MASPTYESLKKQLDAAQRVLDAQIGRSTPLPTPTAQPVASSALRDLSIRNSPGASGGGSVRPGETAQQLSIRLAEEEAARQAAMQGGARGEEFAPNFSNSGGIEEVYNKGGSITGELDKRAGQSKNNGGTQTKPKESLQQLSIRLAKQNGVNSYFTYNANGVKKANDNLSFRLNQILNDPYTSKGEKKDKQKALIEASAKTFGGLFSSPDEIYSQYNSNPEMKTIFDQYIKLGGSLSSIAANVSKPVIGNEVTVVGETENPDGTRTIQYSDGTKGQVQVTQNPDGTENYTELSSGKDVTSFLAGIKNPQANKEAQDKALNELIPERDIYQQQIAQQVGMADDLRELYFGNEEAVGLQKQKELNAIEEKRILEKAEKEAEKSARDRARMEIQRNKAEVAIATAKVEQNRLAARNYMTGYLAKIGALNVTGAAAVELSNLEYKYQAQVSEMESDLRYENRKIEVDLVDTVNKIENDTDSAILAIQEDLTKDTEQVAKEVMKQEQASAKEVLKIREEYAKQLRLRTTAYETEIKKAAIANAKAYAKIAAGGVDLKAISDRINGGEVGEGDYVVQGKKNGVIDAKGNLVPLSLTPTLENEVRSARINGADTIQYFITLPPAFRKELIQRGGGAISSVAQLQQAYEQYKSNGGDKSLETDASKYREKLGLQSISWGEAWNAMKAKYPKMSNEEIDAKLNKDSYYTTKKKTTTTTEDDNWF